MDVAKSYFETDRGDDEMKTRVIQVGTQGIAEDLELLLAFSG